MYNLCRLSVRCGYEKPVKQLKQNSFFKFCEATAADDTRVGAEAGKFLKRHKTLIMISQSKSQQNTASVRYSPRSRNLFKIGSMSL